jgi:hypothetical protein
VTQAGNRKPGVSSGGRELLRPYVSRDVVWMHTAGSTLLQETT